MSTQTSEQGWTFWLYQSLMSVLALAVVGLLFMSDAAWTYWANLVVWGIFTLDYGVRLFRAADRRRFVRDNVWDLVAILPFDYLFGSGSFGLGRLARLVRFTRLFRLVRAGLVLRRTGRGIGGILRTNGLSYVLCLTAIVVVGGGVAMWLAEPEVGTPVDAIWWGLVTAAGYGTFAPTTVLGRVVAGVLMIFGIGTAAMITGSVATYFISQHKTSNPHVAHVIRELERWDALTHEERRQLIAILGAISEQVSGVRDQVSGVSDQGSVVGG